MRSFRVQEYNLALARLSDLHRDQATLRDSLFAAADLPATPDQTWEAFIRSGQGYRRHLESVGARDDTRCLHCRQLLGNEAVQLIARYSNYLESQIATDIQEQEAAAKDLVKPLHDFSLAAVQAYIENVDGDTYKGLQAPPDRIEAFRSIVDLNAGLQQNLTDGLPIDDNVPAGISGTRVAIESWLTDVKDTLKELRNQDSDRETSLKEKENELIELKDYIELCQSWAEIEQIVASAQRAKKTSGSKSGDYNYSSKYHHSFDESKRTVDQQEFRAAVFDRVRRASRSGSQVGILWQGRPRSTQENFA